MINGTTVNFSPEGYFFANPTTLYIADTGLPKAGGNADGGIQKWSYSAANQVWTLDYTLKYNFGAGSDETGFESLAGQVVNGVVNLYATSYTSADDAPDGLYGVTDNLSFTTAAQASGEAVVQLAASLPDMDFKGVAVIPAATPTQPATDTPTLPQWGLILLAMALVLTGARQVPRKGASPDRRKLTRPRETSNAVWGSEPAQSPPHSPPGSLTRARSAQRVIDQPAAQLLLRLDGVARQTVGQIDHPEQIAAEAEAWSDSSKEEAFLLQMLRQGRHARLRQRKLGVERLGVGMFDQLPLRVADGGGAVLPDPQDGEEGAGRARIQLHHQFSHAFRRAFLAEDDRAAEVLVELRDRLAMPGRDENRLRRGRGQPQKIEQATDPFALARLSDAAKFLRAGRDGEVRAGQVRAVLDAGLLGVEVDGDRIGIDARQAEFPRQVDRGRFHPFEKVPAPVGGIDHGFAAFGHGPRLVAFQRVMSDHAALRRQGDEGEDLALRVQGRQPLGIVDVGGEISRTVGLVDELRTCRASSGRMRRIA
ncbi:MAG: IPTL-CTERM sorting domain-containing protein [Verrucomicrobiota bacterium]